MSKNLGKVAYMTGREVKVYLAGPEVFLENARSHFNEATALCGLYGFEALVPLNPTLKTPKEIFEFNRTLIRQSDFVLAHLDPFRGSEPDSGTVWEMGFAYGLHKPVIGYLNDIRSMRQKALNHFHYIAFDGNPKVLDDGMVTEDFGSAVNLMLGQSSEVIVQGGLKEALEWLSKRIKPPFASIR